MLRRSVADTRGDCGSGQSCDPLPAPNAAVWLVVGLLISVQAVLVAYSATRYSPTLNEPAHLAAGISHWEFGRFELYRVNPPLVRMLAALPCLAAGYTADWSAFVDAPGSRSEMSIGRAFVAANGERTVWLMSLARWACLPLVLSGGVFAFLWARECFRSDVAGLTALGLWSFEPTLLGHGALITPDTGAAAFGLAAGYYFWRWLKLPGWNRAVVAGVAMGLAQLTKATWVVLFALWPALWLLGLAARRRMGMPGSRWTIQAAQLASVLAVALYVVNLGYTFDGSFARLGDFTFVSRALSGKTKPGVPGNRFEGTIWEHVRLPVPRQYVLGIDLQKKDFEVYPHDSYLRGEWRERGWWYYYLYATAVKLPHGTQAVLVWGLLGVLMEAVRRFVRRRHPETVGASLMDLAVILLPAVVVFVLVSSQLTFNHHFRYVLPALGFLIVGLSGAAVKLGPRRLSVPVIGACWLATAASSLSAAPFHLSYFNELAGGPGQGHRHLLGSNLDWGQGLLEVKRFAAAHPEARPLFVVGRFGYNPANLGLPCSSYHGDLFSARTRQPPAAGWYAVSINELMRSPEAKSKPVSQLVPGCRFVTRLAWCMYIFRADEPPRETAP